MRTSSLACELLLLLPGPARAVLELAIARSHEHGAGQAKMKRQSAIGTNVYDILTYSAGGAYYANVTVGTRPQQQVVLIATAASDLYFDASSALACQTHGADVCRGGTFTPGDSNTYSIVEPSPAFNITFGDGSTASGPWAEDVVCISDVCITDVQFGVATQLKSTTGIAASILGIGYSFNEATQHKYPNLPEVLKDAGVIDSRLYSIYLNDEGATSGSILFGGIDTTKYLGPFQIVDTLPNPSFGFVFQFITTVTALTTMVAGSTSTIFSGGSAGIGAFRTNDSSIAVQLDTGSAAWSVPTQYYEAILKNFPYVSSNNDVDCIHADSSDTLTLTFAGVIDITVPVKDFIVPVYKSNANPGDQGSSSAHGCVFMIFPSTDTTSYYSLGIAVLRSMYVVFDLDNAQMGLAQANVNSTQSPNINVVSAGPNGIANAVYGARSPPAASSSATYSIASEAAVTATYVVSTAKTTIGTATGIDAVPTDARLSATSGTTATSKVKPTPSKGAAAGSLLGGSGGWGAAALWWQGLVALMGLGAWLFV